MTYHSYILATNLNNKQLQALLQLKSWIKQDLSKPWVNRSYTCSASAYPKPGSSDSSSQKNAQCSWCKLLMHAFKLRGKIHVAVLSRGYLWVKHADSLSGSLGRPCVSDLITSSAVACCVQYTNKAAMFPASFRLHGAPIQIPNLNTVQESSLTTINVSASTPTRMTTATLECTFLIEHSDSKTSIRSLVFVFCLRLKSLAATYPDFAFPLEQAMLQFECCLCNTRRHGNADVVILKNRDDAQLAFIMIFRLSCLCKNDSRANHNRHKVLSLAATAR